MTDLESAIKNLNSFSICLCKNKNYIFSNGTGISPMMNFIAEGRDLTGWSAAAIVVGKAVAMLFIKSGIISVYGKVMSVSAKEILDKHDILCKYEILTDKIINRKGTDICPMEKTVKYINDIEEGYQVLKCKLQVENKKTHLKKRIYIFLLDSYRLKVSYFDVNEQTTTQFQTIYIMSIAIQHVSLNSYALFMVYLFHNIFKRMPVFA